MNIKKSRHIVVFFLVSFLFCVQAQERELWYVKVEKGNLRNSPNGDRIAEVLQGTELKAIEEKDDWVKVQVTGWIWKGVITPDKTKTTTLNKSQTRDETEITGGFAYKNVSFKPSYFGSYIDVIGEITNYSRRGYQIAIFTISIYDQTGRLLGVGYILISNFNNGQTKSFETTIEANYNLASKYKITFESGF